MAKKKTETQKEFERIRKYVVEHIQNLIKEMNSTIKEHLDNMKKAPDVHTLMIQKKYLLMEMVDHLPIGYSHCYFCVKDNQNCGRCEYGKKYGVCTNYGSNFDRISGAKHELEELINDLYWND